MAAKKDKYDKLHDKELAALLRELDAIYADLANEVGSIGATYASSVDKSVPFVLSKYPLIQKRVDAVLKKLAKRVNMAVVNGVKSAWTLANQKNNELCRLVFGSMLGQLTKEQERRYFTSNDNALQAFLHRKVKGMNLSDRVWDYSDMCRTQIEATLELGIKTGEGAAQMATDLKTYLKYPDKLFRRVRGADGKLHLSKAAAAFHPGQGVYRSSYQNAYRLARTETNMAYRTSDHMRHTQLDFIVGIEIHLSNNHTCLGRDGKPHPFTDICDELKGVYPKWFDFKGWHPACRCFTTTILKTDEEIERDMDGIDRGSVNEVKEMPPQWSQWLQKNQERVDMAAALGRLPYFLRDNPWAWQEGVEPPWVEHQRAQQQAQQQSQKQTILQRAQARHEARTPEEIADIKRRWNERQIANNDAKMVLRLADSIPDLGQYWQDAGMGSRKAMLDALRNVYTSKHYSDYGTMEVGARAVLSYIKELRDSLGSLVDPLKALQDHGPEKAVAANQAVKGKLDYFNSSSDLDWRIKKLKFEIDWLDKPENQKYSTWKLAQDAYRKALEETELQKFWNDVGSAVDNYMATAKAKFPLLYARMRVAYKNKAQADMLDLIAEVKEEIKWEANRSAYESLKANYPVDLLEKNNEGVTFMTDLTAALNARDGYAFKKALAEATKVVGRYAGLQSEASGVISELKHYFKDAEADALANAVAEARLDDMENLIKEGKWTIKWIDKEEEYFSYSTNDQVNYLDSNNKFGYLAAMKKAVKDQDEYTYDKVKKDIDAAVGKYNQYEVDAFDLVKRLVKANMTNEAIELKKVLETYVFADIEDAIKKATKQADWGEIKKKADDFFTPEAKEILKGLQLDYLEGHLYDVIAKQKSMSDANLSFGLAEKAVNDWRDLVDSGLKVAFNNGLPNNALPASIEDPIHAAINAYDRDALEQAIQAAKDYVAVFGKIMGDLADIEGKKGDLKAELSKQKAELKKKRADISARRKDITDEANRIKTVHPTWSEAELKKYSSEWQENEKKRKAMNADAKALRDKEAILTEALDKFDKWDDSVAAAHQYLAQEDAKNAQLFVDILKGIEADIRKLGGGFDQSDWDDETYTQARKDAAFWAKPDPSKGIHDSQDAMRAADKVLRQKAGEAWNAATEEQKDAIYGYTSSYHNIQEPLRGITYYGSSSATSLGLARIPRITEIIESSSYDFDMWVQRFDDKMSLMKFGINPYQTITDDMMNSLVGKTGTEGAFWSAGCAKGGGYKASRNITYNIYCPRGTKMMYIEPISACGNGSGRSWNGKSSQSTFGSEIEALIQRGTTFRVTKVEKRGSGSFDACSWFIDVEIIAQKPLPFPYAGGVYPYTKFNP